MMSSTLSAQENTGTISGSVVLTSSSVVTRSSGRFGNPYQKRQNRESSQSSSQNKTVLIWLERSGGSDHELRNKPLKLNQKNKRFKPSVLPVIKGETVRIFNSDRVYHNVFSLSREKRFDVGRRPKGEYKDVTFNKTGVIDVFCDIHSNMHAIIVVMPKNTYDWVERSDSGNFTFENVPPGRYTLKTVTIGFEMQSRDVGLKAGEKVSVESIRLER